jgi:thymidylate kinase
MAQASPAKQVFPLVYHSLKLALKTLTGSEIGKSSEVKELLQIGVNYGILERDTLAPIPSKYSRLESNSDPGSSSSSKPKMPFIVVEGLDGTGKSHVSRALNERLGLELRGTPPEYIKHLKGFFNDQREPVKRAYFAFGNYLAAAEVVSSKLNCGNVMDRYWHSTAAYAISHEITKNIKSSITPADFIWPYDLLQPDLVLFLTVSEEIRVARHAKRNTTNTKEEKMLTNNGIFRENLINSYLQITGPKLLSLNVDEDIEIVKTNICKKIGEMYPVLLENGKVSRANSNRPI